MNCQPTDSLIKNKVSHQMRNLVKRFIYRFDYNKFPILNPKKTVRGRLGPYI